MLGWRKRFLLVTREMRLMRLHLLQLGGLIRLSVSGEREEKERRESERKSEVGAFTSIGE